MHWDVSFLWSNRFNKLKKNKNKDRNTPCAHVCMGGYPVGCEHGVWDGRVGRCFG